MSEEDIKIQFLLPYLVERGYKQNCMDFNVAIEVQEGRKKKTIFADVLVYTTAQKKAPLLLCETKAITEPLDRNAREQAISYARLLPQIAPLVLLTNSSQVQVYHTLHKSRLPELPKRNDLDKDLLRFVVSDSVQEALRREAKHELFIIDDVQTFKSLLKACHNEIRNNEGLDPTAAFDEMSKVMFCKLYEEKVNPAKNRFRLAVLDDTQDRLGMSVVQQIFNEAKNTVGYRDILPPDAEINLKGRTIGKIVGLLEDYDLSLTAFDVKGEAFEYFLGDTFTGGLGEYFTPRNVVEFIVEAMDPKIGERIIDPFCGTGGFLIYAFEIVGEKIRLNDFADAEKKRWREDLSNRCLSGTDWKERTSQACKMNMMVHGDGSSGIFMWDGFKDVPGKIECGMFDQCMTNPPFGSFENDPDVLARFELGQTSKSQDRVILAAERCLDLVRPGGWVGIVVIDGLLNTSSRAYVRDHIRSRAWVRGVVSLNSETFEGYGARAKTSVLFLEKKVAPDDGRQEPVFMAIARNTGVAANGAPVAGDELPDILMDYQAFKSGARDGWRHGASGVFSLQDRLDAEHYLREKAEGAIDVGSLRSQVRETFNRSAELYAALQDATAHFDDMKTDLVCIADVLAEVGIQEDVVRDQEYKLLGVRWWGEGVFVREQKMGREIKSKKIVRATAGDLIYNRLFAFRASFGILRPEHDGCYVSGEFPMFRAKAKVPNGDLVCRYVVHLMNSPQMLTIVDAESTGSTKTSRNRFNQKLFLAMSIAMPRTDAALRRSVELLDAANALRSEQARGLQLAKDLREGIHTLMRGSVS